MHPSRPAPAPRPFRLHHLAAACALSALVSACGGGGDGEASEAPTTPATTTPTTNALQVTVVDGLLKGAVVCLDRNDNGACDADEVQATTGDTGVATLQVPTADAGKYGVLAQVPVGAVDADHGAVATAFLLRAPADQPALVSPLTTLVAAHRAANGSTSAAADQALKTALGLGVSLFDNYAGKTDAAARQAADVARLLAVVSQQVNVATASTKDVAGQALTDADRSLAVHRQLLGALPAVAAAVAAPAVAGASGAAKAEALRTAATTLATDAGLDAGAIALSVARAKPLTAASLVALYISAAGKLDSAALERMESVAGELTGAWSLSGDTSAQVFFFFANGDYVMADPEGDTENNCGPAGVERGRLSFNKTTGEVQLLGVSVDTNLCAGLHDTTVPDAQQLNRKLATFTIAADGKSLQAQFGDSTDKVFKLTR